MLRHAVWSAGLALMMAGGALGQGLNEKSGPWALEQSGTTAGLRGVHSVGGGVAWASGANGTVLRTEDGGYEWQSCAIPPGAEKLDFRGVWAWDANAAMVMSSGRGEESRLYRTTDGCSHWALVLTNPDKDGFWDGIVFASRAVGYLLGDPVKGVFPLLRTSDGGLTWTKIDSPGLTTDGLGIAAFAASNSALADAGPMANSLLAGDGRVWFATGGQGGTFIYAGESSCARGGESVPDPACLNTWTFQRQPLPMANGSASTGAFSLRIVWWDEAVKAAVAVGGDFAKPNQAEGAAAWTPDGVHWTASAKPPHGYRSAVAWTADTNAWIAVGTNGSDVSWDGGKTWEPLDDGNWNALSLPWAVGPGGRIGKLQPGEMHNSNPAPERQEEPRREMHRAQDAIPAL
jgi:photosystem II stability/assembly factor-like uncharacterized protein